MIRINQYIPAHLINKLYLSYKNIMLLKNGKKYWEGVWVNGKQHGKQIRWRYKGCKLWEVDYTNGKKHGKDTWWRENGKKWGERDYVNGKKVGERRLG